MDKNLRKRRRHLERVRLGISGNRGGYEGYRGCTEIYPLEPTMEDTVMTHVLIDERMWRQRKRCVVFPQGPEILDNLYKANMNILPEVFKAFGMGTFMLAVPKGYTVNGRLIPPCLFSIHDFESWKTVMENMFPGCKAVMPIRGSLHESGVAVSLTYGERYRPDVGVCEYYSNVRLPLKDLAKSIWDTGYLDTLNDPEVSAKDPYYVASSDDDKDLQRILLKICFGLCVYADVFPSAIVEGFPEADYIPGSQKLFVKNLTLTNSGKSKTPHFRCWSFHTLTAERYKAGGPVPRVIFVKPTWVNAVVAPLTVKRSEDQ